MLATPSSDLATSSANAVRASWCGARHSLHSHAARLELLAASAGAWVVASDLLLDFGLARQRRARRRKNWQLGLRHVNHLLAGQSLFAEIQNFAGSLFIHQVEDKMGSNITKGKRHLRVRCQSLHPCIWASVDDVIRQGSFCHFVGFLAGDFPTSEFQ